MKRRKMVIMGISAISVLLLAVIGVTVFSEITSPHAMSRGEVETAVEKVHGDVDLVSVKRVEDGIGFEDVSEYTFKDEDGLEFKVKASATKDDLKAIHDMWSDAYLVSDGFNDLLESHGGSMRFEEATDGRFVVVPEDKAQALDFQSALQEQVPTVPDELKDVYVMLSRYTFEVSDGEGGVSSYDLFGYLAR